MTTWPSNNLPDETQAWRRKVEEILDQAKRDGEIARINGKATLKGQSSLRRALNQAGLDIQDSVDQIADQRRVPAAPTNPSASTDAYFDEYGYPRATVYMTVDPVFVDVTGDPIDLSRYEMHGRKDEAGESWVVIAEDAAIPGQTPQLKALGLPAGENWSVKMCAVSASGVAGEFSAEIKVTLAKDETPPPKPAALTGTSRLGQVPLSWTGKTATGAEQPADFSHGVVYVATTSGGAGVAIGQIGRNDTLVAPEQPYNTARWYYLTAVDFAGNESAASDRTPITTKPLVDTDIIGRVLDGANIKLDSIQDEVIAAGAITREKLAVDITDELNQNAADVADAKEAADAAKDAVDRMLDAGDQYIANPGFRPDQSDIGSVYRWASSGGGGGGRLLDGSNPTATQGLLFGLEQDAVTFIAEAGRWDARLSTKGGETYYLAPVGSTLQIQAAGTFVGTARVFLELIFGSNVLASMEFDRSGFALSATITYTNNTTSTGNYTVRVRSEQTDGTGDFNLIQTVTAVDITPAAIALEAANGKNKNYYQGTAPTGGAYQVGDNWFDTANDNAIHRWNGATWVDVMLGEDAIANLAITNAKIANLDAGKISTGFLNAGRIEALSISTEKLAAGAVVAAKIQAGAVETDKLAANAVTAAKIAANTITAAQIAAGAIETDELAANSITGVKIVGETITGNKLVANTISANEIAANTITFNEIAGNTITAANMAAGSITSGSIFANAVTTDKIDAGAITTVKLDALAVTADKIASNAITTDKLQANAITAKHTITGALIRTAASGARTEMTSSGIRVLNSSNQELVKLGYGITTGMEVRNPATNTLVPLANAAFGLESIARSNSLATIIPVSPSGTQHKFTRHGTDDCILTFTAVASTYIINFSQTWSVGFASGSSFIAIPFTGIRVNGVGALSAGVRLTASAQRDLQAYQSLGWRRVTLTLGALRIATTPGASYTIDMDFSTFGLYNTVGEGTTYLADRFITATPVFQ